MTRNQLLSAVTVTSSGNTPAFSISGQLTGCVTLNISSASGTTPLLYMWLQESDDGGTTWFDVTSVLVQKGATSKTEGTVTTQKRNICLDADAAATYRADSPRACCAV